MPKLARVRISRQFLEVVWLLLFTVLVEWPFGPKKVYKDVVRAIPHEGYYELHLSNGKQVYTPIMWTVVEEQ